jgi:hypothetical protein
MRMETPGGQWTMGQLCGGTEAIGSKPEQWVASVSTH